MFPIWNEDKIRDSRQKTETQRDCAKKVLRQAPGDHINVPVSQITPRPDWLQVHAIDEVIRFLCCEGAGFLELVTNKSETTADHEQQQSGNDNAQR